MRRPPNAPLRDVSEDGSGSLVAFPRTAEGPPNNLPLQLTSFVGRQREMSEVKELLASSRLLTLTGPGGSGKTRLALEVAAGVVGGFEDGVWLVELASLSDPKLVPQAVASVLRLREQPGRPLTQTLTEHLKAKKLLLVLDNCEHLVDVCAYLAEALLRSCPSLRILATSREALGIAGETAWLVPSLSLPDPRHPLPTEELSRYEAVRLFVERAGAVASGFAPTQLNVPAVAQVCRRLEGMPLAIELAASRVKVLPVEQISERLDDCLRLLTAGSRTALPHHKTLRATIAWSHGLLSEKEQTLFRRLSVFAGGFTLEAAEEVCAAESIEKDEVLELLSRLVDKSLVLAGEADGGARYRLLETVRQYAKEKLSESGEAAATRRRHAGFFLKLAETAEPAMLGPEQEAWLERLEVEHDNLRAALDWSEEEEAGDAEAGLRLAGALPRFWWIRGYFTEGQARLERLLALPGDSGRSAARAKAYQALGTLHYQRAEQAAGDLDKARACLEESLEIFRHLGDEAQIAATLTALGRVDGDLGEYASGCSLLEESLMLQRRSGNEHGIALAMLALGWLHFFRGEHATARPLLEESVATLRKLGDKVFLGSGVLCLGCLDCEQGDYAAARSRFVWLTGVVSFQQYRYVAPILLQAFALLATTQGQAARALRLAGTADELRRAHGGGQFRRGWQQYVRRRLESAWQALGEEAGAAAWEEGQKMTLEQAIAYARGEPSPHTAEAAASPGAAPAPAEAKTHPELRIFALGPARVQRGEEALSSSEWTYAKSRELLFYLLIHPSRTKAQIGLDLWPEASPSQLRRTFHATLHHLRRALGSPEWISFEKGRYAFDRSLNYWYDVEAFQSKLAEARSLLEAEGGPGQAIAHLKEAVGLYGGDFLEDFAEGEWALIRQEELRRTYREALLELGRLLFGEGRYAEAVEAYRKAIEHDAYLESAHRQLMRCYACMGERGRALRHYRDLVELLGEELGSSPAPETTELYERLRRNEDV